MSTISKVEFNLATYSIYNKETQAFEDATVTGNVYTVAGVTDSTGALRKLSMGELVMVVGLARAAEKEAAVINLMKEMENTTKALEMLTEIEKKLVDGTRLSDITGNWTYNGTTYTSARDLLTALGVNAGSINENRRRNKESLQSIANQLENGASVFSLGTYYWDGSPRNAADVLYRSGCLSGNYSNNWVEDAYDTAGDFYGDNTTLTLGNFMDYMTVRQLLNDSQYDDFEFFGMTKDAISHLIENYYYNGSVKNMIPTKISEINIYDEVNPDDLIREIESKMDSLNSFSQQKMIELQSETNKRDQAYDMITNILKSLNTVQVGIVNNM